MNNSTNSNSNTIIGLMLIGLILIGYNYFFPPEDFKNEAVKTEQTVEDLGSDKNETTITSPSEEKVLTDDSSISNETIRLYGNFASATLGEKKDFILENDLIKMRVSNLGGRVADVQLKKYQTHDSLPLFLFDEDSSKFNLSFITKDLKEVKTAQLYFEVPSDKGLQVSGADSASFSLFLYGQNRDQFLEYRYTLKGNSYLVDFDIISHHFEEVLHHVDKELYLDWSIKTPNQEKTREAQEQVVTVFYQFMDDEYDYLSETSDTKEDLAVDVKWVSFKEQYFNVAIIADQHFSKANSMVETKKLGGGKYIKELSAKLTIPFDSEQSKTAGMSFYFGPNHVQTLEKTGVGLENIVNLGWGIFGWVNRYLVIVIFNFLDGFNLSYGIIILLLTLIIKAILIPITYKTYLNSAKQRVLKPEIDAINKKFEKDAMKKQQAIMELYRQTGANPLSGCIPMLIQMPILFALFRFFPASIELRQEGFLWADDLSSYDSIFDLPFSIPFYGDHVSLFTILMAVSMIFYSKQNSQSMSGMGGDNAQMMEMQMKIMTWVLPIMMLFMFNSYSSGLSYYYFIANLTTMGQMFVIKKFFVDEEAVRAKLEENKKKPKKKSGFAMRLEEMAKKQQQLQSKKK